MGTFFFRYQWPGKLCMVSTTQWLTLALQATPPPCAAVYRKRQPCSPATDTICRGKWWYSPISVWASTYVVKIVTWKFPRGFACWTVQILTTGQESGYSLGHEGPCPLIKCLTAKFELLSGKIPTHVLDANWKPGKGGFGACSNDKNGQL